ncbi:hypothetical protein COOONC_10419 [Cooperia oncophora]
MEDPDAEETRHFVDQLNAISESFLAKAPSREKIRKRLTELWDYEKYSCPSKHGDFYYYFHNTGLQNQSVLYQQKNVTEKGEVFLDPNTLSPDGTIALAEKSRKGNLGKVIQGQAERFVGTLEGAPLKPIEGERSEELMEFPSVIKEREVH